MNNDPKKHHFIPVFYLERWGNAQHSNNLYHFSKPYGDQLKGRWVAPAGTGYQPHLYTFTESRSGKSINLEIELLKKIDDDAAKVIALLEAGKIPPTGTTQRMNWARFIICQQLRSPEDVQQLKKLAEIEWNANIPDLQKEYDKWRNGVGVENVAEFLAAHFPNQISEFSAIIAKRILVHEKIADFLASLRWRVISFSENCHRLLTSDRPVWVAASLKNRDDFLCMPIGPRKLFVAAVDDYALNVLSARPERQFAKAINEIIAKTAFQHVFSFDGSIANFVAARFGTQPHSTLLELLARQKNLPISNQRSPSFT